MCLREIEKKIVYSDDAFIWIDLIFNVLISDIFVMWWNLQSLNSKTIFRFCYQVNPLSQTNHK